MTALNALSCLVHSYCQLPASLPFTECRQHLEVNNRQRQKPKVFFKIAPYRFAIRMFHRKLSATFDFSFYLIVVSKRKGLFHICTIAQLSKYLHLDGFCVSSGGIIDDKMSPSLTRPLITFLPIVLLSSRRSAPNPASRPAQSATSAGVF